ncbi:hypothetical protein CCDG5_0438 [[Clostridium] cellulosi]|jgi:hypothetical protein|uniref:Uncharacterized protein n=1 Tax=[Clostridium] cellulosi TaxID=29343 RepID=A0A078KJ00_9FIRM|nr:MAG: hypothetical protein DIU81_00610 [[Clostridium] cellulosi]CDZ23576.1 hypothetical protein CCDG5_0438 [[Clostridium] cellulosi]
MSIYTVAEFDSVDLADLASGKVRDMQGVVGIEVLRNRFAARAEDENDTTLPFIPVGTGWSYTSGIGGGPFYSIPFSRGFDDESGENFEPSRRRDALLKVETKDQETAQTVSYILRNLGGRGVSIVKK